MSIFATGRGRFDVAPPEFKGPSEEVRQRVRSYLITQAEKYDWLELWPRVVGVRAELLTALAGVSDEQAAWKPSAETWSIREITQHVLSSSRWVLSVVEQLARGESAGGGGSVGGSEVEASTSLGELRPQLAEHSADFAAVVRRLPARPSYAHTRPHPAFGELNCRAWFLFARVHDLDHLGQVTAIKEMPGYPAARAADAR